MKITPWNLFQKDLLLILLQVLLRYNIICVLCNLWEVGKEVVFVKETFT